MTKESLDSRRIRVINHQTSDIHSEVASLNEALVDREPTESLELIESIKTKLNILKRQVSSGELTQ